MIAQASPQAYTERHREAMARNHGLVQFGLAMLRKWAPMLDEADAHDIAVNALERATRKHDLPNRTFYGRCLKCEMIDWARSARNIGGMMRSGKRRPGRVSLDVWSKDESHSDADSTWVAVRDTARIEDRDAIDAALARLPSRQRRILEMRHIDGLSDREIARELGVSYSTVFNERKAAVDRFREERGEEVMAIGEMNGNGTHKAERAPRRPWDREAMASAVAGGSDWKERCRLYNEATGQDRSCNQFQVRCYNLDIVPAGYTPNRADPPRKQQSSPATATQASTKQPTVPPIIHRPASDDDLIAAVRAVAGLGINVATLRRAIDIIEAVRMIA